MRASCFTAAALAASLLASPAGAQNAHGVTPPAQETATTKSGETVVTGNASSMSDIASAGGYRSSRIVGAAVYNDSHDSVGTVDDLILSDTKPVEVILSVGGILGLGDRLVAVPFARFTFRDNKVTLPDATKEKLKSMPEFHYVKNS